MLSRSVRSVLLRSKIGSRVTVGASFPRALNNLKVVSHFRLQSVQAFSTGKAKEEEPATNGEAGEAKKESAVAKYDYDEHDDYEYDENMTSSQKVKHYAGLAFRLSLLAAGIVCVVYTARELFPGRMNPNSLFSEAFEKLRYNEDVIKMAGNGMKAFGRDVGRNTEGRRNHIDSYDYTAEDGSKRTRVRFNVKGDKAKVLVFAEISDRMADGEFVYLICQNSRTGKVFTVADNRDQLENDMRTNADPSDSLINKFFFKKEGTTN